MASETLTVSSAAAFLWFAVAVSLSPGPNNLLIASTTVGRSFRTAVPAILGVSCGFLLLLLVSVLGLGSLIQESRPLGLGLQVAGGLYLVYLAYKIFTSAPSGATSTDVVAGFWKLFWLQLVNPKAWIMALTTSATYSQAFGTGYSGAVLLAGCFTAVNLASNSTWALIGVGAGRVVRSGRGQVWLNRTLAVLLAASVVVILATEVRW